jgi:hypothetical protein
MGGDSSGGRDPGGRRRRCSGVAIVAGTAADPGPVELGLTGMIAHLRGTILKHRPASSSMGVGYESGSPPRRAGGGPVREEIALHTVLVVREDALTLYGFAAIRAPSSSSCFPCRSAPMIAWARSRDPCPIWLPPSGNRTWPCCCGSGVGREPRAHVGGTPGRAGGVRAAASEGRDRRTDAVAALVSWATRPAPGRVDGGPVRAGPPRNPRRRALARLVASSPDPGQATRSAWPRSRPGGTQESGREATRAG